MSSRIAVALATALLCACGRNGHAVQGSSGTVRYSVDPAIAGESNVITIAFRDAPRGDLKIVVRMVDMRMAPATIPLQKAGDTTYATGNVRFSMSGNRIAEVRVTDTRAPLARFAFVVGDK